MGFLDWVTGSTKKEAPQEKEGSDSDFSEGGESFEVSDVDESVDSEAPDLDVEIKFSSPNKKRSKKSAEKPKRATKTKAPKSKMAGKKR